MTLAFQSSGTSGPPLLILHGMLGSSDNWVTIARRLGETHRVFALDARNHGRSPHDPVFNYRVMTEDVRDFMDQHRLERASLLGHSMGGKTAMFVAVNHPERVDKLVVVDIAPKPSRPTHDEIFDAVFAIDLKAFRFRKDVDEALAKKIPNVSTRQFLMKNLQRTDDGVFSWKLDLPTIYKNYSGINEGVQEGSRFEGPTMFLRGETSPYIKDEDGDLIRKIFPSSRIVTIPGAGHWVHADAPDAFARSVLAFLK